MLDVCVVTATKQHGHTLIMPIFFLISKIISEYWYLAIVMISYRLSHKKPIIRKIMDNLDCPKDRLAETSSAYGICSRCLLCLLYTSVVGRTTRTPLSTSACGPNKSKLCVKAVTICIVSSCRVVHNKNRSTRLLNQLSCCFLFRGHRYKH